MTSNYQIMKPVSLDKSRIFFFKIMKSFFYSMKEVATIFLRIKKNSKVCANNIERISLHKKNIGKNPRKERKNPSFSEGFTKRRKRLE